MTDPKTAIDHVIDKLGHLSELAQINDDRAALQEMYRNRCGHCTKWMKSRICPKERNVNGYSRGPSNKSPACSQFEIEPWFVALREERETALQGRILKLQRATQPPSDT